MPADARATGIATGSAVTRGGGLTASAATTGLFNATNWETGATLASAITHNKFLAFSIAPDAGYRMSLASISYTITRHNNSIENVAWTSSVAGHASANAFAATSVGTSSSLTATLPIAHQNLKTSTEFRLYGYNAKQSDKHGGFGGTGNDLVVNGDTFAMSRATGSVGSVSATKVVRGFSVQQAFTVGNTNNTVTAGTGGRDNLDYSLVGAGYLGNVGTRTPGQTSQVLLSVDTSSTGVKGGSLTLNAGANNYSIDGVANQTSKNYTTNAVTVYDVSNVSVASGVDDNSFDVVLEGGSVLEGETASFSATVFNIVTLPGGTPTYTLSADFDGIDGSDPRISVVAPQASVAAGTQATYTLSLDTTGLAAGSHVFSGVLKFSDQDDVEGGGATGSQSITYQVQVQVVPEPALAGLLGLVLLVRRRGT